MIAVNSLRLYYVGLPIIVNVCGQGCYINNYQSSILYNNSAILRTNYLTPARYTIAITFDALANRTIGGTRPHDG